MGRPRLYSRSAHILVHCEAPLAEWLTREARYLNVSRNELIVLALRKLRSDGEAHEAEIAAKYRHENAPEEGSALRGATCRARIKADDDVFDLKRGDVYYAKPYWLNPEYEFVLIGRVADGREVSCIVYREQIDLLPLRPEMTL